MLLEGEFKETSVERCIYHLYSLVHKAGITRSSIEYMNRIQVPEYGILQLSVNFVQVGESECYKMI